jgi:DNA-binding PadR family transcriptional regulator
LEIDEQERHLFLAGLIRLHVLHHAVEGELYGRWMIEELGRHGYRLSPGTLYPLLHALERKGYLKSRTKGVGRRARRLYRATRKGRTALRMAKERVRELFGELIVRRRWMPSGDDSDG